MRASLDLHLCDLSEFVLKLKVHNLRIWNFRRILENQADHGLFVWYAMQWWIFCFRPSVFLLQLRSERYLDTL